MADITDPTVIAYINEYIRPTADRRVGLNATRNIQIAKWFATMSGLLAANADSDVILDGSENGGRTPLTKGDVVAFMTQELAMQTQEAGAGVFDVLSKPSVNVQF